MNVWYCFSINKLCDIQCVLQVVQFFAVPNILKCCPHTGKGLTIVANVIEGQFHYNIESAEEAKQTIERVMKKEKAKGFSEVIVSKDQAAGMSYLVQGAGIGGLRHNSVLLAWPRNWRNHSKSCKNFIGMNFETGSFFRMFLRYVQFNVSYLV